MEILVVGGGFFGMYISEYLAIKGHGVTIVEREADFMQRASFRNQARVHNGYHYPRSILTALRSKASYPQFIAEFKDCIDDSFEHYYMISNTLSKTSAQQFQNFCERVGLICRPAPRSIKSLVNPQYIEDVFTVEEFAFNAHKLKDKMIERIQRVGIKFHLGQEIDSIQKRGGKFFAGELGGFHMVFNCTYAMINSIIRKSGLEAIPLKHQLTEMALVKMPSELGNMGMIIMDGPFFSLMPFPCKKGLHSFSHVHYTPHIEYDENYFKDTSFFDKIAKESAWKCMLQDAIRYIPLLSECRYQESLWEIKTFSPTNDHNDSRPILFRPDYGFKGFHQIIGGKMDNVYDIINEIGRVGITDEKRERTLHLRRADCGGSC